MSDEEKFLEVLKASLLEANQRGDDRSVSILALRVSHLEETIKRAQQLAERRPRSRPMQEQALEFFENRDFDVDVPREIAESLESLRKTNEPVWEAIRQKEQEQRRLREEERARWEAERERTRAAARERLRALNRQLEEEKRRQRASTYFNNHGQPPKVIPPVAGPKGRKFNFDE